MSTRSTIWIKNDNEYRGIYVHFDGYIKGNGKILLEHYNSVDKINSLIELGNVSALGETINDTIFYHRDRDEDDLSFYNCSSLDQMEKLFQQYNYLYQDGEWYVIIVGNFEKNFNKLKDYFEE